MHRVILMILLFVFCSSAWAGGWHNYKSSPNNNYIFTESTSHTAPVIPHLMIWCNKDGFDISLSPHELVGNGKDVHSLTKINLDGIEMKAIWGISTSNKALFIERLGDKKIHPVDFIALLLKHRIISIEYPALVGQKFTKRKATFSMIGARDAFSTYCSAP